MLTFAIFQFTIHSSRLVWPAPASDVNRRQIQALNVARIRNTLDTYACKIAAPILAYDDFSGIRNAGTVWGWDYTILIIVSLFAMFFFNACVDDFDRKIILLVQLFNYLAALSLVVLSSGTRGRTATKST